MSNQLRRTSSPERTLTQRELAAMRPAVETPRRQSRRVAPLREITSGVICFCCGERFGEAQALDFMLHLRAKFGETLSWAARERERARRDARLFNERAKTRECPPSQHGKPAGYNKYRCRCDECCKAGKALSDKKRKPVLCACGCGEMTKGWGLWKQGHANRGLPISSG